ncbi:MAG: TlpA family protein disulfide reductase [Kangiellaceae bacterium]|nr:TlpA family protein disulfide reductase [Kangiellaceae bacterium]
MKPLTNKIRLLSVLICINLLSACATPQQTKTEYLFFKTAGDQLPISKVTDIDGNPVDLNKPNKRKLVILFATWCSDSQRALTALNSSQLLKEEDLEIIAIAREETNEIVSKFKQERGFTFTMAADPKREIYSKFANAGIPRFIMVDKNNTIIDHVVAEGENQLDKIHWN